MELAGTEWSFPGEVGKDPRSIRFGFDGRVGGSTGCNRFAGSYIQDGRALTIGTLATTRRACPPEVIQRERKFLALLEEVRRVEASYSKLTLKDADGNVLGELRRRDVD